jgi:tetratricopeptide (TPR) repeat protein
VKASFQPWTPSPANLFHTIASGDWPQAKQALELARKQDPEALAAREASLNQLGRQLLAAGHKQEALSLMEYAVTVYPASGYLAGSLSEVLEATGQKPESIEASRRALKLLEAAPTAPADRKEALAKALRERIARLESKN